MRKGAARSVCHSIVPHNYPANTKRVICTVSVVLSTLETSNEGWGTAHV